MNEAPSWRILLEEVISRMDAGQKSAFYAALGVNRVTVQRWRNGENTPGARHIEQLLASVPADYQKPLQSLMREDPDLVRRLPEIRDSLANETSQEIPVRVYEQVLRTVRNAPDDPFWLLCEMILSEIITQIEHKPQRIGVNIIVAQCMSPRDDGTVRSLRARVAQGTGPWRMDFHERQYFLGAESLAGAAVMQRHGIVVQDLADASLAIPIARMRDARSSVAYPIMRGSSVAGALMVSSAQHDFFAPWHLHLIECYADLIREAFPQEAFYSSHDIDLALLPSFEDQDTSLATFRQRVNDEYRRSMQHEGSLATLKGIELRVRQQLESEFLQIRESEPAVDPVEA